MQQSPEEETPFVYVTLATLVTLATAGYTPCLFGYVTIGLARYNRTHFSQSERLSVKPKRPCTDLCAEPVGVWNRLKDTWWVKFFLKSCTISFKKLQSPKLHFYHHNNKQHPDDQEENNWNNPNQQQRGIEGVQQTNNQEVSVQRNTTRKLHSTPGYDNPNHKRKRRSKKIAIGNNNKKESKRAKLLRKAKKEKRKHLQEAQKQEMTNTKKPYRNTSWPRRSSENA